MLSQTTSMEESPTAAPFPWTSYCGLRSTPYNFQRLSLVDPVGNLRQGQNLAQHPPNTEPYNPISEKQAAHLLHEVATGGVESDHVLKAGAV